MHPLVFIKQSQQSVGICRFQFAQGAPVQNSRRKFVALGGKVFQNVGAGLPGSGRGLFALGAEFAKENISDLFRRADVKLLARQLVNLLFIVAHFQLKVGT